LKLSETRTNFSRLNFEEWKFSEKSDEVEERNDLVVEKYFEFDGLKLEKKYPSLANDNYIDDNNDHLKDIVFVETTKRNLNKLVMSIISDYCIVIEGDLSTGKTMLVEYLARETNNTLIKYQMDDFMDSKVRKF
jgi:midasin (ATPase involved in ribosome maturation)